MLTYTLIVLLFGGGNVSTTKVEGLINQSQCVNAGRSIVGKAPKSYRESAVIECMPVHQVVSILPVPVPEAK